MSGVQDQMQDGKAAAAPPRDNGGSLQSSSFETDLSAPRRRQQQQQQQADRTAEYSRDPKFQKYVQLVERNLQSFEY
ncbi:hypothetical protein IWQ56_001826, partial [Coemansia nantahalensis]